MDRPRDDSYNGDERSPRAGDGGLLLARFAVPEVERLDTADHTEAAPEDLVRARVPDRVVRTSRPVDQHRQSVRAGLERVRDPRHRRARNYVARADRDVLPLDALRQRNGRRPELERAVAVEDDEDLLVLGVALRDRAMHSRVDPFPVEPSLVGALAGRERRGHERLRPLMLDLIDVDDVWRARGGIAVRERRLLRLDVP